MQRINADPAAWLAAVRDTSIRNHRYAASGDFFRFYAERFDRQLVARMATLIAA
jgi:hypothetical protein